MIVYLALLAPLTAKIVEWVDAPRAAWKWKGDVAGPPFHSPFFFFGNHPPLGFRKQIIVYFLVG